MSEKPRNSNPAAHSESVVEDMPTVTTLLNRRKLRADPLVSGTGLAPQTIKATTRPSVDRRKAQRLELWTADVLGTQHTPELIAVQLLLAQRVDWALLLLKNDEEGLFEARAVAGGSRERWAHWTGLRWGEPTSPAVWKAFTSVDFLGLKPQLAEHQAMMTAVGVLPGERLWIFRTGPRDNPIGVLFAGSRQDEIATEILQKVSSILR